VHPTEAAIKRKQPSEIMATATELFMSTIDKNLALMAKAPKVITSVAKIYK